MPAYVVAQFLGAILATLLLWALIGKQGSAGLTLPGPGVSTATAMLWEVVLTTGLVSTILGTASGAQQLGALATLGVGSYIALAGLWGSPVSGASMNTARSLGPALVLNDWNAWWAYLVGPIVGAVIAVGIAHLLRGPGRRGFRHRRRPGDARDTLAPGADRLGAARRRSTGTANRSAALPARRRRRPERCGAGATGAPAHGRPGDYHGTRFC